MPNSASNDSRKIKLYELINNGRIDEAIKLLNKICRANEYDDEEWLLFGNLYGQQGKYHKALNCFEKAVKARPENDQAHFMSGFASQHLGQHAKAIKDYQAAIQLNSSHFDARYNLGSSLLLLNKYKEALEVSIEGLKLEKNDVHLLLNAGNACYGLNELAHAEEYFQHVLELNPDMAEVHYNLAKLLSNQNKLEQSLFHYQAATRLEPDFLDAVAGEVNVLIEQGEMELACKRLEPYLAIRNSNSKLALASSALATDARQQHDSINILEQVLKSGISSKEDLRQIHFQLGKLYDQVRSYDLAFMHYQKGNQYNTIQFDCVEHRNHIEQIISAFSQKDWLQLIRAKNDSELPVFIVGMPRSGKTLVEQILSSHTHVTGAGERNDIYEFTEIVEQKMGKPFPSKVSELTEEELNELANIYLSNRQAEALPGSTRVTDTMPFNVDRLGFIMMLFPRARIIHCRREPRDLLLECYFKDFSKGHLYSTDLANLACRYQEYLRISQHWKDTLELPQYEVNYEELVREPERVIRQLLEYLGLEWQPRCLEFYKTDNVRLTSKPVFEESLNDNSVGHWKNYEQHIQPLLDALQN